MKTLTTIIFAAGFLAAASCSSYRLDHFHSESNDRAARSSLSEFEAFTDQTEGLLLKLVANLQAQTDLDRAVSEARQRVEQSEDLTAVLGLTWGQMLDSLKRQLGVSDPTAPAAVWAMTYLGEELDHLARALVSLTPAERERPLDDREVRGIQRADGVRVQDLAAGLMLAEATFAKVAVTFADAKGRLPTGRDLLETSIIGGLLKARGHELRRVGSLANAKPRDELTASDRDVLSEILADYVKNTNRIRATMALGLPSSSDAVITALGNRAHDVADVPGGLDGGWELLLPKKAAGLLELVEDGWRAHERLRSFLSLDAIGALISRRARVVEGIGKVFTVLLAGERALVVEARRDVDRAKKAIEKLAARLEAGEDTGSGGVVEADEDGPGATLRVLRQIRAAIEKVAEDHLMKEGEEAKADELVRAILAAAKNSRDPASAHLIVASIGSGLSPKTLDRLEKFHDELRKRIAKEVDAADARDEKLAAAVRAMSSGELGTTDSLKTALETLSDLATRLGLETDGLGDDLVSLLGAVDDLRSASTADGRAVASLAGFETLLARAVAAAPGIDEPVSKILKTEVERDGKKISFEDYLTGVLKESVADRIEARRRVAEHIAELHRIRVDLHGENARHFQVMTSIVAGELGRWRLVLEQMQPLSVLQRRGPSNRLFAKSDVVEGWNTRYPAVPGKSATVDAESRHPVIAYHTTMVASLRRLAAVASWWQRRNPNLETHADWNTRLANDRLQKAVEIVDRCLVVTSINRTYAETNGIRLRTEIAEHDIYLDHVVARTEESAIRLALRDLSAFHATGITGEDIQAVIAVVQNGLLAWIGTRS